MTFHHPVKSTPFFLVSCLAFFAVSCTSSSESTDASSQNLISLSEACDGIFKKGIVTDIEETARGKSLKDGVEPSGGDDRQLAEAVRSLNEGTAVGSEETCRVDGESGGEAELIVQFAWQSGSFPSSDAQPGTLAVYDSSNHTHALIIDCRRSDLFPSKTDRRVLRASLVDRVGLNSNSAAKILIASAKKVTSSLDCEEEIKFPTPPEIVSGLK